MTYDLRKILKKGDVIEFDSMFACNTAVQLAISGTIPYTAKVVAIYEAFCIVQLKVVKEGVNRWDITKINGKPVDLGRRG